jgi:hypothetical protein
MTVDELLATAGDAVPPPGLTSLLQALWLDAHGDWEGAHELAQDEASPDAAWVHAYLHRKEGDAANAAYWYRSAAQPVAGDTLDQEWRRIAGTLLARV